MNDEKSRAFQDHYPDDFSHCYGCGRLNPHGHQLKSFWSEDGDTTLARFTPKPFHSGGVPDHVYGGLIASLLDCHGSASAAAVWCRRWGRDIGDTPAVRFVTASLSVDYLKPTPMEVELTVRGRVAEVTERKVIMTLWLEAKGEVCAKGRMVAVKLKE